MTSEVTITPAPTLPTDWDPPPQSSCLQKGDIWQWDWDDNLERPLVLGGPPQTTACLPPVWNATGIYGGRGCPPHYSEAPPAPMSGDTPAATNNEIVTCCPTVHRFSRLMDDVEGPDAAPQASSFRCISQYTEPTVRLVTVTYMRNDISTTTTATVGTNRHLFALALMYQTQVPPPSNASEASPGSLSAASSAGIGVGAGVGTLLVAAGAFFLCWRRRKAHKRQKESTAPMETQMNPCNKAELASQPTTSTGATPWLQAPIELQVNPNRREELPAQ